jgi:hypothetical protein
MKIIPHKSFAFLTAEPTIADSVLFTFNQSTAGANCIATNATGMSLTTAQLTATAGGTGTIAAAVTGPYGTYRNFTTEQSMSLVPSLLNAILFNSGGEWTMMWECSNAVSTIHVHMVQYNAYGGSNGSGFICTTSAEVNGTSGTYGLRLDFQGDPGSSAEFTDQTYGIDDLPTWFALWVENDVLYYGAHQSATRPSSRADFDEILTVGDVSGLGTCDYIVIGAPSNGTITSYYLYNFLLSPICLFPA